MGLEGLGKLIIQKPKQCEECGGALEYLGIGKYKCVECGAKMLDDYGKIKEYLWEHGPTPAITLSRETGVSREKINYILNEGSLGMDAGKMNTHSATGAGDWGRQDSFTGMGKTWGNYTRYH